MKIRLVPWLVVSRWQAYAEKRLYQKTGSKDTYFIPTSFGQNLPSPGASFNLSREQCPHDLSIFSSPMPLKVSYIPTIALGVKPLVCDTLGDKLKQHVNKVLWFLHSVGDIVASTILQKRKLRLGDGQSSMTDKSQCSNSIIISQNSQCLVSVFRLPL